MVSNSYASPQAPVALAPEASDALFWPAEALAHARTYPEVHTRISKSEMRYESLLFALTRRIKLRVS